MSNRKFLKKNLILIFFILLCTSIIGGVLFLTKRKVEPLSVTDRQLLPVTVMKIKSEPFSREVVLYGTAVPFQRAMVSAEVAGNITWISSRAEAGLEVRKGDPLIRLDDRTYQILLNKEEANLKKAKAELELQKLDVIMQKQRLDQISTEMETAEKELKRKGELLKKKLYSMSQFNMEESAYARIKDQYLARLYKVRSSDALVKKSEALLDVALANRDRTALDMERTEITAPFDGVMKERFVEYGGHVRQKDNLFEIVNLSTIIIETDIPASMIKMVKKGVTAEVRPGVGDSPIKGELKYISPEADHNTRLFHAQIHVASKNLSTPLSPGVFTKIILKEIDPLSSIAVPFSAITEDGKGRYLFITEEREKRFKAVKKYLNITWEQKGEALIKGLNDGDIIVVKGYENLADDADLEIVKRLE